MDYAALDGGIAPEALELFAIAPLFGAAGALIAKASCVS